VVGDGPTWCGTKLSSDRKPELALETTNGKGNKRVGHKLEAAAAARETQQMQDEIVRDWSTPAWKGSERLRSRTNGQVPAGCAAAARAAIGIIN
jgi:hypothetical protein